MTRCANSGHHASPEQVRPAKNRDDGNVVNAALLCVMHHVDGVSTKPCCHRPTKPARAAPRHGASQKSQSWLIYAPPANSAGPVLRAGLTDAFVTGINERGARACVQNCSVRPRFFVVKIAHFGIWCGVILGAAIGPIVDGWSVREAIMKKQIMLGIIVGVAVIATPVSFNAPREDQAIVTLNSAEAKVGQPMSATSVAGVNRRQGRREKRKSN
jgi:hypothetical protein